MDISKVKSLRRKLTLHFAVIAWLTAMLVASGSGSIFLPVMILFVSASAFLFVDTLEWFEVGRIGSYFLMTLATSVALGNYIYSTFYLASESGQLLAVASLLVYPEAVLFLQKKNLRIYEQLAVFLLLEMIVAALVNDNIVFGVLLTPIMLLWVSSLFLFARYSTLVHVDSSIEAPIPHLAELMVQKFRKTVLGTKKEEPVVRARLVTNRNVQGSRLGRRLLQSAPIGVGALAFSGFFFYLMPRTSPGSLRRPLGSDMTMGIPKSLTLGDVGRLKADPSPVMRVSLRHRDSGKNYEVHEAPYLRARILDTYVPARISASGKKGLWTFSGTNSYRGLPKFDSVHNLREKGHDLLRVDFDIRRRYLPTLYALHASFEVEEKTKKTKQLELKYEKNNVVMEEIDVTDAPAGKAVSYRIGAAGFVDGLQLPIAPVQVGSSGRERFSQFQNLRYLLEGFDRFFAVEEVWRKVLAEQGVAQNEPYRVARTLESYFVDSGEFRYSLDLAPPDAASIDPIDDFLINKRVGHCQYFASALVAMMRQAQIPSRVVIGYHPREFNEPGRYFAVKQSDAHAWVEGLFQREQLIGTDVERWLTDASQYWVRFDPTPYADGESEGIVQQQGQALDYAEKLWKDYVVDAQQLSDENSLYAPVAENSKTAYDNILKQVAAFRSGLGSGPKAGDIGFAWPLAILVFVIGAMVLLVWRLVIMLPRFAPRLARKLGVGPKQRTVKQAFFARCLALLQRMGFAYDSSETPQEFTQGAARAMETVGVEDPEAVNHSLKLLTDHYYMQRFGGERSSVGQDEIEIHEALRNLESAAERVSGKTPPK